MDAVVRGGQMMVPTMVVRGPGQERRGRRGEGSQHNNALLDFTVYDGTAAHLVKKAAQEPGYATTHGFRAKLAHYLPEGRPLFDATSNTFIPIVMDLHGFLHAESAKFYKQVALYESARSGGVWPAGRCMERWRQLLSVTLQRAVVEGMERNLARSHVWARRRGMSSSVGTCGHAY
jgi:hypothetical protein